MSIYKYPSKVPEGKRKNWHLELFLGLLFVLALGTVLNPSPILAADNGNALPKDTMEKIDTIEKEDYVYIFCDSLTERRVQKIMEGSDSGAKMFNVDIKFFGPSKPYDTETTLAILNKVIEQSPAGIAIEIAHPSKFDEAIGKAVEKGIITIGFKVDDWTNNPRQAYVGYEWREEGARLAGEVFKNMAPLSRVLILDSVVKKSSRRLKGVMNRASANNLNLRIISVKPKKEAITRAIKEQQKDKKLDGIISLWSELTGPLAELVQNGVLEFADSTKVGGFGSGQDVKYMRAGSLDVLNKIVPAIEGGTPIHIMGWAKEHQIPPGSFTLTGKLITE